MISYALIFLAALVLGLVWGVAEGTVNAWRFANLQDGIGSDTEARLGSRWHAWMGAARLACLPALLAAALCVPPLPVRASALVVLASVCWLHVGHQFGHNAQQGKPWHYRGAVSWFDVQARRVGVPGLVSGAFVVATLALSAWALA